jgi:hypothetical protein
MLFGSDFANVLKEESDSAFTVQMSSLEFQRL